ncbi:MAG: hypothetical protein ACYCOU_11510 [Sulfobacillus sp.]
MTSSIPRHLEHLDAVWGSLSSWLTPAGKLELYRKMLQMISSPRPREFFTHEGMVFDPKIYLAPSFQAEIQARCRAEFESWKIQAIIKPVWISSRVATMMAVDLPVFAMPGSVLPLSVGTQRMVLSWLSFILSLNLGANLDGLIATTAGKCPLAADHSMANTSNPQQEAQRYYRVLLDSGAVVENQAPQISSEEYQKVAFFQMYFEYLSAIV